MENKSLIIIILVIVAILIIGFAFFQSFKNSPVEEEQKEEELIYPKITPEEVTQAFYDWYLEENNSLPSNKYEESDLLTSRFKNDIAQKILKEDSEERDPFVCSSELPLSVKTTSTDINDRRANVVVDSNLSDVEMISFISELNLTEDNSAWQINNVVCFVKGL